nr:hypothetical protein BN993_03417 [Virgibacillus halodenitrificans]
MGNEKVWLLIQKLFDKTSRGEVAWKETESKLDYQVSFSSYSVRIGERESNIQNNVDYVIFIINEEGDIVEAVNDVVLNDNGYGDAYAVMGRLFSSARRKARGVDKALDDLLGELDDDL